MKIDTNMLTSTNQEQLQTNQYYRASSIKCCAGHTQRSQPIVTLRSVSASSSVWIKKLLTSELLQQHGTEKQNWKEQTIAAEELTNPQDKKWPFIPFHTHKKDIADTNTNKQTISKQSLSNMTNVTGWSCYEWVWRLVLFGGEGRTKFAILSCPFLLFCFCSFFFMRSECEYFE